MWTPAFMVRRHGWDISEIGVAYGTILVTCSTSGILLGGWWADRLLARGQQAAFLRVSIVGALSSLPFAVAAPLAPTGDWAMASLAAMSLLFGLTQGMPAASLQAIAPNRLRARVMALYLLVANLVAFTLGPTGVALISDYLFRDPVKIGLAVAVLSALVVPLGALALYLALPGFRRATGR
jgi:MFS family permease